MFYTFGSFFICNDSSKARNMSQDHGIDCVTIDGDIYRAQGMITGGAPPKIHNFISRAHEFKDTDEQIKLNEV